ncbi:uncharacterized protein LOC117902301 [Drosophila subobscura]|uniref:uncharacterized protein LOC117902301 n=1 Tax=Drosophila subobscura TaxID=7241 RepID=UPI00155A419C|nr:uncharacterized protein LOC117902301 [Drosophila subobscura]
MKAALVFLLLALTLVVAVSYAASDCNPDGNGKPDCTGNVGKKFRNFWDPTRYWLCETAGEPSVVLCENEAQDPTGYDPVTQACVDWALWQWYAPCA